MVTILVILLGSQLAGPPENTIQPELPSLTSQLEAYFRSADAKQRRQIAKTISEDFRFDEVKEALSNLDLWEPAGGKAFDVSLPSGKTVQVTTTLPMEHETRALPLIVELAAHPAPTGAAAAQTGMGFEAGWVAVRPPAGGSFYLPTRETADLPFLMREIRRRIRVDTDRVYLFGEGKGAEAAWIAAMMYPREFTGLIVINGIPHAPYPEQILALLLPNLRHVPFLSIWSESFPEEPPSIVAVGNKAISDFAVKAGVTFETATLAPVKDSVQPIPKELIAGVITRPQSKQTDISHWFRYLQQGNAGWLRVTDLGGEVWEHEQISISSTSKEDRDKFITDALKDKLFHIGGRIEGQTITLETHRIAGIELCLSPYQIDFTEPVTVAINGRERFSGVLEPSIEGLLDSAYDDWDFQHPPAVRKSFSINAN